MHRREVLNRIDHLNSLPGGMDPVPVRDMVSPLAISISLSDSVGNASSN